MGEKPTNMQIINISISILYASETWPVYARNAQKIPSEQSHNVLHIKWQELDIPDT